MAQETETSQPRWPPLTYWAQVAVVVLLTAGTLIAARRAASIFIVVVIALVLAVGLEPAVVALGRIGIKRGLATAIIFLVVLLFVVLFAVLLVPPLVRQTKQFADAVPGYISRLNGRQDWIGHLARQFHVADKLKAFLADLPSRVGGSVGTILGVAGSVLGTLFEVLTAFILTIYFMLSLPRMRRGAAAIVAPEHREPTERVIEDSIGKIGGYVSGNLITSGVCGVLAIVALLIIGVPYAVPPGMWAGVSDLIPQVGSYLGAIPAVAVAFFVSPLTGVITVVYFIAYQQFENYLLAPKVMQNAIDLSPAAVIISTLIGGSLLGFSGALLALPVAATVKVTIVELWLADRIKGNTAPASESPQKAPGTAAATGPEEKGGAGL